MPLAHQLRVQIERQLAQRIPAALTPAPQQQRRTIPSGVPDVDAAIGGLPLGAVTELTGSAGSGRTTLSLAAVAQATRNANVAAWVDTSNALDPQSAAVNGIVLDRLLWIRCAGTSVTSQTIAPLRTSGNIAVPHTDRHHGGGSPHPRSEERGLPEAVNALLSTPPAYRRNPITGTPGAPNRQLAQASAPRHRLSLRIEQAGSDRQPSRRGDYVLQQREHFLINAAYIAGADAPAQQPSSQRRYAPCNKPWPRIDQAIRVTDLLLQAGGFQIIVLDLADVAAEHVSRVPLATWFRFRTAAEHAQSALLVLTQHPCTGSSSALLLKLEPMGLVEQSTYFPGLRFSFATGRQRFTANTSISPIKKPAQRVTALCWGAPAQGASPA